MTISETNIGLFAKNDFNSNSHKVMLFDFDLNIISEKMIEGPSSSYSGQISSYGEDIFIAQIYSGDLDFNNEITLPYSGVGNQPYIAKIGDPTMTSISNNVNGYTESFIYPYPAKEFITLNSKTTLVHLKIIDLNGNVVFYKKIYSSDQQIDVSQLSSGIYFTHAIGAKGEQLQQKLLIHQHSA